MTYRSIAIAEIEREEMMMNTPCGIFLENKKIIELGGGGLKFCVSKKVMALNANSYFLDVDSDLDW